MSEKKVEKEASQQAALFEERVRSGQTTDGHIKFQDFAERWFSDYADIRLRPTAIKRYRDMTARINPALGHLYIDRIRPANLMAFYRELSNTTINSKCRCKIDLKARSKKNGVTKEEFAKGRCFHCRAVKRLPRKEHRSSMRKENSGCSWRKL